ncbi:MAG: ATP-binding protein [Streptosporangiales bacterium]|nr:ATP-binding protein [Streptosporangiales bacterium]
MEPRYSRQAADDAAIVVAELAANAFQHAGTGFSVTVHCAPDEIRISVRDHGFLRDGLGLPPVQGHGLHLVDRIAGTWGTVPLRDGKTVWARLPVR